MGVDSESFSDVLKHPIRRKVILVLSERKSVSYTDLMGAVEAANTGKFNYHLKILGDLITKDAEAKYVLTEKGKLAAEFLQKFPEKKVQQGKLGMADAALIGLVGVVLTAANPAFITAVILSLQHIEVSMEALTLWSYAYGIYGLMVPGAVMWLLSVRRAYSHDFYDLFKPAFVAFVVMITFVAVMILGRISLGVTISTPAVKISEYGFSHEMVQTSLATEFMSGIIFAFVGITISEVASRITKKWALRN